MDKRNADDVDVHGFVRSGTAMSDEATCFTPSTVKVRILDTATSSIQMLGAVVWLTETYPHLYQMQLPGGAPIFPQRMGVQWERVPADTPLTTPTSAKKEKIRQRWRLHVQSSISQTLHL